MRLLRATASGLPPCVRPAPRLHWTISAAMPPNGIAFASSTLLMNRSRLPSGLRWPTGRSVRCSISAPAPAAGLDFVEQKTLRPEQNSDGKIAVSLWLGRDPRVALAEPEPQAREVA